MNHSKPDTKNNSPVALVTGGARRIGKGICEALHHEGYNIIIHYNASLEPAQSLADAFNQTRPNSAVILHANLNVMEDVKDLAVRSQQAFGKLNLLVNNASSFYPTPLTHATESQWLDLMNSNLKAPFFLSKHLAECLTASQGCIINMADIYSERPMPNHSIYSIAKAGNRMMTMALAQELAPAVRVNGIAPGAILWPEDAQGNALENPSKLEAIPLRKLGGTQAITRAVTYLALHAPYTTGQVLAVDGGKSIGL